MAPMAAYRYLYGVSEGSDLADMDFDTLRDAHIYDVSSEDTLAAHLLHRYGGTDVCSL